MLNQMLSIAQEAGQILLSARDVSGKTHEKTSPGDLVTDYDLAVERFLREKLLELLPEAAFFGEEAAGPAHPEEGWTFIVDPIDGTTNFVHGLGQSAVSIALARDAVVEYAAVCNPYKGELFCARRGGGAFCNGAPIRVSGRPLKKGIFSMGTALYRPEYFRDTMGLTEALFRRSCDFRRMGAAVLDLCDVACGRVEAFFEYSLCPWDYAAGSLLVAEAGGVAAAIGGGPLPVVGRSSVWACGPANLAVLHEALKEWEET